MLNLPQIVQSIHAYSGVTRAVILDNRGIVRAEAGQKDENKLTDYIAFIAVTSAQVRTYLSISAPLNARVTLSSGQTLLILFAEEVTVGILLDQDSEYLDIIDKFAAVINELKL